jgi:PadR family transcriptional regulator, regulatory protein PadR
VAGRHASCNIATTEGYAADDDSEICAAMLAAVGTSQALCGSTRGGLCKILCMDEVRPTRAVVRILKAFLDDLKEPKYGYLLMTETGFSSAKTYQVLGRLTGAGWLDRFDDPDASPQSGGPPRITYRLRGAAVPMARRLVAEAQEELAPAPRRRSLRGTAHALGWV